MSDRIATEAERYMAELINEARAARGLEPLLLERNLNAAAQDQSDWMNGAGYLAHTRPDGSNWSDRIRKAGFDMQDSARGENVGLRQIDNDGSLFDEVRDLMAAFVASRDHLPNILGQTFNYDYVGIGMTVGRYQGVKVLWVTQTFGLTAGQAELDVGTGGHDKIRGNGASEIANLLGGNDWMAAGAGDDRIAGGSGHDRIHGEAGRDRLDGGTGDDTLEGGADADVLSGGGGRDALRGDAGHDDLDGGSGGDWMSGGAGNDRMSGGTGNDRMKGGSDKDWLGGGGGRDRMDGESGDDTLKGHGDDDVLKGGTGDDRLDGGGGHDAVDAGQGRDVVVGGRGNDLLLGRRDGDWIYGGDGDDTIEGNGAGDVLKGNGGHDDILGGRNDDRAYGGSGNDSLALGNGSDYGYGGSGDDSLEGDTGDDVLSGGDGQDRLDGGRDNDRLTGGLHADTFVMREGGGRDRVTDFEDGRDTVLLDRDLLARSGMTVADMLKVHGDVRGGNAVLDFGSDEITFEGLSDVNALRGDIGFFG